MFLSYFIRMPKRTKLSSTQYIQLGSHVLGKAECFLHAAPGALSAHLLSLALETCSVTTERAFSNWLPSNQIVEYVESTVDE